MKVQPFTESPLIYSKNAIFSMLMTLQIIGSLETDLLQHKKCLKEISPYVLLRKKNPNYFEIDVFLEVFKNYYI
jgi:hypothetical protein